MWKETLADLHVLSQVLSIGETVEEVSDSGFLPQAPTLKVQLLADDSMLQVGLPFASASSCISLCSYLFDICIQTSVFAVLRFLHLESAGYEHGLL